MSSNAPDLTSLFQNAMASGVITPATKQALVVPDLGQQIQAGLGIAVDDVSATEVTLVGVLVDDSSSISSARNEQAVRDGHNLVVEALKNSKAKDSVLLHTAALNGPVINPFRPLEQVELLTPRNYQPWGSTPLYDRTVVFWGTILAKAQEFSDNGVPVRTVSMILSDGANNTSVHYQQPSKVAKIAADMINSEMHILAAMGVEDGFTDFRQVFSEMGILDKWILTPGNTPSEIRQAFQVFSQSAVSVSQNAGNFSQAAMGGFVIS